MLRLPRDIASVTASEGAEHRAATRLRCDARCSLGRVLDLSLTGLLIQRRRAPKPDERTNPKVIWLEAPDGDRVFLEVRLMRHERVGWRKHETGYTFVDLSPEKQEILREIARCSVRHEHGFGGD